MNIPRWISHCAKSFHWIENKHVLENIKAKQTLKCEHNGKEYIFYSEKKDGKEEMKDYLVDKSGNHKKITIEMLLEGKWFVYTYDM